MTTLADLRPERLAALATSVSHELTISAEDLAVLAELEPIPTDLDRAWLLDELASAMLTQRWATVGTHNRIAGGTVVNVGGQVVVLEGEGRLPQVVRLADITSLAIAARKTEADYANLRRLERAVAIKEDPTIAVHGSASTYCNFGCRCDPCHDAHLEAKKAARRRGRAA